MDTEQLASLQEKLPADYIAELYNIPGEGEVLRIMRTKGSESRYCMCKSDENLDDPERVIIPMLHNIQGSFRFDEFGDLMFQIHREIAVAVRDGTKIPFEYREVIERLEADEQEIKPLRKVTKAINWAKYLPLVEQPVLH